MLHGFLRKMFLFYIHFLVIFFMFIGYQEFICQCYALSEEYQECYIAYMVFETKRRCKRKSHLKFVMTCGQKFFFWYQVNTWPMMNCSQGLDCLLSFDWILGLGQRYQNLGIIYSKNFEERNRYMCHNPIHCK